MVIDLKKSLREKVRHLENSQEQNMSVEALIRSWPKYRRASKIAFYIAMKDELSLEFLFASGKDVFLPRYDSQAKKYTMALVESRSQLISGNYGIEEPAKHCREASANEIELWFIPGMAFSKSGDRLGRGAGFYDRLLENENGLKVGVCTAPRLIEEIPCESHDIKMNFVITDKEVIIVK